ncbi:MAG: 3-phosphoserine/phosphohydroxythreonine transaminase [Phycisphaeraceae bacterium]|nr:3-phosphoserine/phosphohydroxythreonine transaminase [Phycisphaeraceae bacterium]
MSVASKHKAEFVSGLGVGMPGAGLGRLYNFCAGPSMLPEEVLRQAQEEVWNVRDSGIGIMELSHRGKLFDEILHETEASARKVGNIPSNYQVLFLTGGATTQNHQVPANVLPDHGVAAFLTTGYWSERTWEEIGVYTDRAYEAFSGKKAGYAHCPTDDEIKYKDKPVYVHMCTNNTLYGTQWREADGSIRLPRIPDGSFLVADMCSDIFSRPVDWNKFGIVYAGAQKNVGIAGISVVIVREDLLKPVRKLPRMMSYEVLARDESRHNTPPVFPIYMCNLVFNWILKQGGVAPLLERNREKAQIVYDVLDKSKFYKGHARPDSRSLMNLTFHTPSAELDDLFCEEAFKAGMDQIKGHRNTGGMRASMYNAFPREGAVALAEFMREFEKKHG